MLVHSPNNPHTGAEGGNNTRSDAPASTNSSAAPLPAVALPPSVTEGVCDLVDAGVPIDGARCGWCNVIYEGDPARVNRVGAVISTGICNACLAQSVAALHVAPPSIALAKEGPVAPSKGNVEDFADALLDELRAENEKLLAQLKTPQPNTDVIDV